MIVRKDRLHDFKTNKKISKVNTKTGQKFYKSYINYVEARNNDGVKSKLKAAYSTELVLKLIALQDLLYLIHLWVLVLRWLPQKS